MRSRTQLFEFSLQINYKSLVGRQQFHALEQCANNLGTCGGGDALRLNLMVECQRIQFAWHNVVLPGINPSGSPLLGRAPNLPETRYSPELKVPPPAEA